MKTVIFKLVCVVMMLVMIAVTYVVLQTFGERGVKIFRNGIVRWTASFVVGIGLFLLGVNIIFT